MPACERALMPGTIPAQLDETLRKPQQNGLRDLKLFSENRPDRARKHLGLA